MDDYFSIIKDFSRIKVLVIGDVMLDRYWWGDVSRISPEAPVPVVNLKKTSLVAGGAANVAANINGLGAETVLIGTIGFDDEADLFLKVLDDLKISSENLLQVENRSTTIKTRIVAHNQHVVRIDQENAALLEKSQEDFLFEKAKKLFLEVDVIVLSDYAKGVLTENLAMRLITKASEFKKPMIVDPKGKNYHRYKGATLITPNQSEALLATEIEQTDGNSIDAAGKKLLEENSFESVLITRGENGMTLYRNDLEPEHFKASARKVYDVTGAGDTVIATLAVAYGLTKDLIISSDLANSAAGLVVEEVGTTTITAEKLKNYLSEK
ncbi:MAG: D-glycero-beta-D-manno-heptose-7-phosphate kinase [Aridibacter sp.]